MYLKKETKSIHIQTKVIISLRINYLSLRRFALKWDQIFNPKELSPKELNPYDDIWSIRGLLRIPEHSSPSPSLGTEFCLPEKTCSQQSIDLGPVPESPTNQFGYSASLCFRFLIYKMTELNEIISKASQFYHSSLVKFYPCSEHMERFTDGFEDHFFIPSSQV